MSLFLLPGLSGKRGNPRKPQWSRGRGRRECLSSQAQIFCTQIPQSHRLLLTPIPKLLMQAFLTVVKLKKKKNLPCLLRTLQQNHITLPLGGSQKKGNAKCSSCLLSTRNTHTRFLHTLLRKYCYPYFSDKETEAQRD